MCSVLSGPKAHAFNQVANMVCGCQGSSSKGKSLRQARSGCHSKRFPLGAARAPGPRPRAQDSLPSRHAQREAACISQSGRAGRRGIAPAWPEVEILSVGGVPVTAARGRSGCASAAAPAVPSGLRAVSGPWGGGIGLRRMGIPPPACSRPPGAGRLPPGPTGSGRAPACSCPRSSVRAQVSGKMTCRSTATTAGSVTSWKLDVALREVSGLSASKAHGCSHVAAQGVSSSDSPRGSPGSWGPAPPARGPVWPGGAQVSSLLRFSASLQPRTRLSAPNGPGEPSTE